MKQMFTLGLSKDLPAYKYKQGVVFNLLTFTGIIIIAVRLLYIFCFWKFSNYSFILFVNALPLLLVAVMLGLMYRKAYTATIYLSFIALPVLIFFISVVTNDRGVLMFFFPVMAYVFYFMNSKLKIVLAYIPITLFFIGGIMYMFLRNQSTLPSLVERDVRLEVLTIIGVIIFTFVSLYSIKFAIWGYQRQIKKQQANLLEKNREIEKQNRRLEQSNKINIKLFSIISHDLRSPISVLRSLLETKEEERSAEILVKILPELKDEVKKTSDLFNNLIRWAKVQLNDYTLEQSRFDINAVIDTLANSFDLQLRSKELSFRKEVTSTTITADKDVLEIVLRNLISNAVKFTDKGGLVSIRSKTTKGHIQISVCDTGRGICSETLEKINAQAFYSSSGTMNEKGTGLGLIICKDLVERSGGSMHILSKPGLGTEVVLLFAQPEAF